MATEDALEIHQTVKEPKDDLKSRYKQKRLKITELEKENTFKDLIQQSEREEAELESGKRRDDQDILTSEAFCTDLQVYIEDNDIDEQYQRLCMFTKLCITEENYILPLKNVELRVDFSYDGSKYLKVTRGLSKQKIRSFLNGKGEPTFQWEKADKSRRLFKFTINTFNIQTVAGAMRKLLVDSKGLFQDIVATINSGIVLLTFTKMKDGENESKKQVQKEQTTQKMSPENIKKEGDEKLKDGASVEQSELESDPNNQEGKVKNVATSKDDQTQSEEEKGEKLTQSIKSKL